MRKIRDVLRYRHSTGLSLEAIARALNVSNGVVAKYLRLARKTVTCTLAGNRPIKATEMRTALTTFAALLRPAAPEWATPETVTLSA